MIFKDIKDNDVELPKNKSYKWRPATYGFLVYNNKLLCIKPKWDNKYALPGGGINLGEEPIEALKREFLEETGYKIKITKTQPSYFKTAFFVAPISKNFYQSLIFFYEIELESNSQELCKELGKETKEICWKNISEINIEDFTHFQKDFIKEMLCTILEKEMKKN